jgi:hypothetical protein
MPADILATAIATASTAEYDYHNKEEWKRQGRAVLRKLAKDLGLAKGTFDIRVCEGGPAVAGDCILHSETLYVNLTWSHFCDDAGYIRVVKGRQDYTGERNISVPKSYDGLLRITQGLQTHGAAYREEA